MILVTADTKSSFSGVVDLAVAIQRGMTASSMENYQLHVVFLPYFTTSHMIPLINAARLFASHGVKVTIISTPANTSLFSSQIDQEIQSGHQISVTNVNFPAAELGLPEGMENITSATSTEMMVKLDKGFSLLQKTIEDLIIKIHPHCIFSDMFYSWTNDVAEKLKIPRLLYYPNSCFSHSLQFNLEKYAPHEKVNSDSESFLIPGLPDQIEMKRSQLEDYMIKSNTRWGEMMRAVKESELRSYGIIHDTIYELESAYVDYCKGIRGRKYWTLGPLFHLANRKQEQEQANVAAGAGKHSCFEWLDTQEPNTVLYISFGSMTRFSDSQLVEIALALDGTNQPFIWVVKNTENTQENWLPEGFEDRLNKSRKGLIFRSWAPQLMILRHPAVGGFMTHCGWNSLLEALNCGVPLITWPLFAEQFYNEKFIQVRKLGVSVGSDVWNLVPILHPEVLGREKIEEAIKLLMGNSEESKKIRQNAEEAAATTKKAVEEGGSSQQNLVALIEELKSCAFGFN